MTKACSSSGYVCQRVPSLSQIGSSCIALADSGGGEWQRAGGDMGCEVWGFSERVQGYFHVYMVDDGTFGGVLKRPMEDTHSTSSARATTFVSEGGVLCM